MVLIATQDEELAVKIGRAIEGDKHYLIRAEEPWDLRHKIHSVQPEVVVLDVRLGGSRYEALHQSPEIIRETASQPAVVILTPWEKAAVRHAAARHGCSAVVNVRRRAFAAQVAQAVSAAQSMRRPGQAWLPEAAHSIH